MTFTPLTAPAAAGGFSSTTLLVADAGGAGQSIPNNAQTTITDWAIVTDNTATFANGIYTAPSDGHYLVACTVVFSNDDGSAGFKAMLLTKNGTVTVALRGVTSDGTAVEASKSMLGIIKLAKNDTIRVAVFCQSTLTVSTSVTDNNLAILRIA